MIGCQRYSARGWQLRWRAAALATRACASSGAGKSCAGRSRARPSVLQPWLTVRLAAGRGTTAVIDRSAGRSTDRGSRRHRTCVLKPNTKMVFGSRTSYMVASFSLSSACTFATQSRERCRKPQ